MRKTKAYCGIDRDYHMGGYYAHISWPKSADFEKQSRITTRPYKVYRSAQRAAKRLAEKLGLELIEQDN